MKKGHNDFTLTPREMEILEKLSKGLDPKAIAKRTGYKIRYRAFTLEKHIQKTARNRMIEAVARAKENWLIR